MNLIFWWNTSSNILKRKAQKALFTFILIKVSTCPESSETVHIFWGLFESTEKLRKFCKQVRNFSPHATHVFKDSLEFMQPLQINSQYNIIFAPWIAILKLVDVQAMSFKICGHIIFAMICAWIFLRLLKKH